jgi:CheY-like chemotaxis protein
MIPFALIQPPLEQASFWERWWARAWLYAPQSDGEPGAARAARRLLLVEDDYFVALLAQTMLEDAGYVVVEVAVNAREALAAAQRHAPDLVLMDIRLEGRGDGIDAARQLLEELGLRCVFVTAHHDPDTVARGSAAQPLGWVEKPFSDRDLVQAVSAAFDRLDAAKRG